MTLSQQYCKQCQSTQKPLSVQQLAEDAVRRAIASYQLSEGKLVQH